MKKETILIVEDEHDCAELLRYHLQKENYQTEIARDGKEAVEAVQRRMPDAVLLDIMLPELDGWEVCRILREGPKGKTLPIIMLTALSDEEERIQGLLRGADDYVPKPYSMKELLLKLRKLLDRQQTVKQLIARELEKDTALRYMVHELQNSLAAIGGFSSRALKKDDSNKYLKTINTAAYHAESLLKDASLLSRIEAGEERLSMELIDIRPLVSEAVDLYHDEIKEKNIEILTAKNTPSLVRGDKTAIMQILINLISNAVKYNRNGGKVWINFDDTIESVNVSIQDEGSGIRNTDLVRIFEKFYRTSESRQQKGAGLGLYIVKHLAEAMGGKVAVNSHIGIGSTFTLSLIRAEVADLRSAPNGS